VTGRCPVEPSSGRYVLAADPAIDVREGEDLPEADVKALVLQAMALNG
jgi:hypothetical protein